MNVFFRILLKEIILIKYWWNYYLIHVFAKIELRIFRINRIIIINNFLVQQLKEFFKWFLNIYAE